MDDFCDGDTLSSRPLKDTVHHLGAQLRHVHERLAARVDMLERQLEAAKAAGDSSRAQLARSQRRLAQAEQLLQRERAEKQGLADELGVLQKEKQLLLGNMTDLLAINTNLQAALEAERANRASSVPARQPASHPSSTAGTAAAAAPKRAASSAAAAAARAAGEPRNTTPPQPATAGRKRGAPEAEPPLERKRPRRAAAEAAAAQKAAAAAAEQAAAERAQARWEAHQRQQQARRAAAEQQARHEAEQQARHEAEQQRRQQQQREADATTVPNCCEPQPDLDSLSVAGLKTFLQKAGMDLAELRGVLDKSELLAVARRHVQPWEARRLYMCGRVAAKHPTLRLTAAAAVFRLAIMPREHGSQADFCAFVRAERDSIKRTRARLALAVHPDKAAQHGHARHAQLFAAAFTVLSQSYDALMAAADDAPARRQ